MTSGTDVIKVPMSHVLCDPKTNGARYDSGLDPKSANGSAMVDSFAVSGWKCTSEGIVEATPISKLHRNPWFKDREGVIDRMIELRRAELDRLEAVRFELATTSKGTAESLAEAEAAIEYFNEAYRDKEGAFIRPEGEIYWLVDGHQRHQACALGASRRLAGTIKSVDEGVKVPKGLGDLLVVPVMEMTFKNEDERFYQQADANESKLRTAIAHTINDRINIAVTMVKRGKSHAALRQMFGHNPGAKLYYVAMLCIWYKDVDIFGRLVSTDQNPGKYTEPKDRIKWEKLSHQKPMPKLASSVNAELVERWNNKQEARKPDQQDFTEVLSGEQVLDILLTISHRGKKKGTLTAKQWEAGLGSTNPILRRIAKAHEDQDEAIFEKLNEVADEFKVLDTIVQNFGPGTAVGLLEAVSAIPEDRLEFVSECVVHLGKVKTDKQVESVSKYLSKFN